MSKTRFSLTFRITFVILFSFSLILFGISFAVNYSIRVYLLKEARKQLLFTLDLVTSTEEEGPAGLQEIMNELSTDQDLEVSFFSPAGQRIEIINEQFGIPLAESEGFSEVLYPVPELKKTSALFEQDKEYHALVYRSPLLSVPSPMIIQLSRNLAGEDHFLEILRQFLFLADLFGLAVSFILGFSISKRILKPVDHITATAQRISALDLSERIPESGKNDELTRLTRAFNGMLARLEKSFIRQNRFVSDASHELRTPLSIISGYIGMLGRWAMSNPDLLEESVAAIKSETDRMRALIDRLLFLARSDSSTLKIKKVKVSLNPLIDGVIADIHVMAPEREILKTEAGDFEISGDPELIKQLLLIFLDNSIRYSDQEKEIRIQLTGSETSAVITIRDFGKGIARDKLPTIFDRFSRVDDSRNKDGGGAGLGLSIAREIIELHDGRVTLNSSPGEGTEFIISFPRFI